MILSAPAKINLGLAVRGRRPDGYHDISTIFLKISLADELGIDGTDNPDITVHCNDPAVPDDSRNLVHRAATALQASAPGHGARLNLRKSIPVAAGLGGGSSDAAAALIGLNTLWNLELAPTEMARHAAAIGSDVPFFLLPEVAALGRGRGDELEPLSCPSVLSLVLVKPPVTVSTAWAYQQLDLTLTDNADATTILAHHLESGDIESLGKACFNDFEPVMLAHFPVLRTIKKALTQSGVYGVSMSGSGPTIYGLCRSYDVAQEVAQTIRNQGWQVWACRTWRSDSASGIG